MNEATGLSLAISEFHFLRPLWLLALIPAWFFFRRLWRLNAQGSAWHRVIDQRLLPFLLDTQKNTSQRLPLYLLAAAWTLAVVALAGPTWSKQTYPVQQRQDALVIVLDLSVGMFATDRDPNRITVTRRKILDILDMRREGQTALIVYAGEAHMVTPLTNDTVSIRAMVPALNPNIMPVIGNNPTHALQMARQLMDEADAVNGHILLLTGGVPGDQQAGVRDALAGSDYPLNIIGVGTSRGAAIPATNGEFLRDSNGEMVIARMDRDTLTRLSSNLSGRYHDITLEDDDLFNVLRESLGRGTGESYQEAEEQVELWSDAGPWLLLLLLPLAALCFRRGWILQLAVTGSAVWLVLAPGQAQAFDLRSLWLNKDQRAAQALEEEDHFAAAELFQDPSWRATANYRAGDYEAAIRDFAQQDDVTSLYNLGNALANAMRLEEAIAVYDAALAQQPDHADALHNKALVEDMLEQQEQEQEEQEQQEQEQEQDQEQEQEEEQNQDSQSESDSDDSQQQQEQEQQEQEQEQEAQDQESDPSEQEPQESDQSQNSQRSDNTEFEEDQESLEQFLRRIEDDPGELLQRKFQFESRRRMLERRAASQGR